MSPLAGIRLVALDLDGTLLPATKKLTERARRVVPELRAAGIHVMLATGKGWSLTEGYACELGIDAPCIALEGALVSRPGADTPLRRLTLGPGQRADVHDALDGLSVGYFFAHDGSRIFANRRMAGRIPEMSIWDPDVVLTDACLSDPSLGHAHVLHLIGEPHEIDEAHARVAAVDLPGVDLFRIDFWDGLKQLQVRPLGVGKHRGLATVLEALDVPVTALLACGDWWNDVEMIAMAAVGVAPSNAVEGVRAAADHVLPGSCEDDAVIRFLEDALHAL